VDFTLKLFQDRGYTIINAGPTRVDVPGFSDARDYDALVYDPRSDVYIGVEVKTTMFSDIYLTPKQVAKDVVVATAGGTVSGASYITVGAVSYSYSCFGCNLLSIRSNQFDTAMQLAGVKTIVAHHPGGLIRK